MGKNKATVIIQARMSSSRLPGKVMLEVMGKPLIGHMLDRLAHAKNIDEIIVATSTDSANDQMCRYLEERNVKVFRGSEDDVLARFYLAAKKNGAKTIVRLTADCPLIDPVIIDRFVQEYFLQKADYLCGGPTLAEGLDTEIFSFIALEKSHKNAKKRSEREHLTQYIHNNRDQFKLVKIKNLTDDSKYRITVDEEKDFRVVRKIFEALYVEEAFPFGIEEIKEFLNKHPEIMKINSEIVRNEGLVKSLKDDNRISIGKRLVGEGETCFIIAEAGSNHDQNYGKALALIEIAADAGADAVKFQVFSAEGIAVDTSEKIADLKKDKFSAYGKNLHELYKKLELPREWLPKLKRHAERCGIIFSATPFDEEAVDDLEKINIPFYKIASFELVHLPLIKYASSKGKPIILSTGMANMEEIKEAVDAVIESGNNQYMLLHCGIEYPPRMEDLHLAAMDTIKKKYSCPIGYSDHTLGITVPIAAVARGAKIIEKHFTINKKSAGPDHKFALNSKELKAMVSAIRDVEQAIGAPGKKAVEREQIYLKRGRRSLFAKTNIRKGESISREGILVLRPASGLMPKYIDQVVGKKANVDIVANEPITWEKIEQ